MGRSYEKSYSSKARADASAPTAEGVPSQAARKLSIDGRGSPVVFEHRLRTSGCS